MLLCFFVGIIAVVGVADLSPQDSILDLNKKLLILGCGGHSKVVTEIAELTGFKNISYLDQDNYKNTFLGRDVFHKQTETYHDYFVVAIGDNALRERVFRQFQKNNKDSIPVSLIHPSSIISSRCSVGFGTVIMPLCVINSCSSIGDGVIINTNTSVDHDNCIKSFASLSPGVSTGGNVSVGERTAISIGTSITHGIKIGSDVVIGASSFVNKDIDNNWVAYGNPVELIKPRQVGDKYL